MNTMPSFAIAARSIRSGPVPFGSRALGSHHQHAHHPTRSELTPQEEAHAQAMKKAILKARSGGVEHVVLSLQSDPSCSGARLTPQLADSLLQKFGNDWKSALGFFEWARSHSNYKHTPYTCSKMVDLLGKMKQIDKMWDLLHDICHHGGAVDVETVAKAMRRLAGARRWKYMALLFDELESMGLDRNTESMNLLLDALCKEKRADLARESFLVLRPHIPPDAHTFNIFVHGWCNARRIDEAMWTIQEMEGWGIKPSVITYSTIIQAYCDRLNFQKVYETLDLMVSKGCFPNVVTYTTVINSLAKAGRIDEAWGFIDRMKSSGCKPDTLFYNSLINVLGRSGQLHEALHVFKVEMQRNGVARSLSTYNTMISIFCQHGQEQNALDILKEMEESSCKPDLQTYRPLLRLYFSKRELDSRVHHVLSDIVDKHNLSLDLDTYTLLIHELCRAGDVEWARLLFDEMLTSGITPRSQTCKLIVNEAERRNTEAVAERIRTVMN